MLLKFIGSSAAAHVGIDYGIKGPTFGTVSACATATHAIGLMQRFIRDGVVDVGVAGASKSTINYGSMKAWQAIRVLSPDGCYPFSKKRNGTVLGEGAGVLVMEELEHAKARGAKILAEVKGFGMASDAKDMINPDLEGPKEAMRQALEDAGVAPSEIDYLNAHGTATALNDVNETHGDQGGVRQRRQEAGHLVDQIDARPSARRQRRRRGGRLHQGDRGRASFRRPRACRSPTRSAISITSPTSGAIRRSPTPCRTPSPSAASTRCSCSAPLRLDAEPQAFSEACARPRYVSVIPRASRE